MGELLRRYWIPALLSEEIPEPDSPPVRVGLFGERLVAFPRQSGPHRFVRGALFASRHVAVLGRNEECGLRCIYHGWKFDVDGHVLETPAERRERIQDQGASIWLIRRWGRPEWSSPARSTRQDAAVPDYDWTQKPEEQTYVTKWLIGVQLLAGA